MKHITVLAALLLIASSIFTRAAETPMNVIFILADDLGWSDTTLYGNTTLYKTPNLERLAKRGLTFTRAHSASPLCSPTRASILTGQTTARTGITAPTCHTPKILLKPELMKRAPEGDKAISLESVSRLDTKYPTLGKLIKAQGYATAHFGKWHLGPEPYSPLEHGFDVDIPHHAGPGPAGSFVAPWQFQNFKEKVPGEHIEDRMAQEAVAWMKKVADKGPFYMNYWQFSVHAPFDAKKELIDYYRTKVDPKSPQNSPTYAAMVHSMDEAVGTLLDAVDQAGIADHTAFIFFSDNGGNMYNGIRETDASGNEYIATPTSNKPLRGGKATMFEGGTRVPCVVVWPGVTQPNTRTDALIQSTDFYPTILKLLGIPLPQGHTIDGWDMTPALRGEKWNHDGIITFFPHAPGVPDWVPPAVSIHFGDWKLIRMFHQGENGAHGYLLYNLKEDIGETKNLAAHYPEKVQELDRKIEAHLKDAQALVPAVNPAFNPQKYRPEDIGVQKGGLKVANQQRPQPQSTTPVKGTRKMGAWMSKDDSVGLRMENNELIIDARGGDVWIRTLEVPKITGAFTIKLDVKATVPGGMKFYAERDGKGYLRGGFVEKPINAKNTWTPLVVNMPADSGTLTSIRINTPGKSGEVRLRNMRMEKPDGALLKAW